MSQIKAAIMAVAATAAFSMPALAEDREVEMFEDIPGQSWIAFDYMPEVLTFTGAGEADTFTFLMPDALDGTYKVSVSVVGDFFSNLSAATLSNGLMNFTLPVVNIGSYAGFAQGTQDMFISGGKFSLTVAGPYSDGYEIFAAAELLSAVPEPETYALFLAGLGLLGFLFFRHPPKY